jgi:hypothetical protein
LARVATFGAGAGFVAKLSKVGVDTVAAFDGLAGAGKEEAAALAAEAGMSTVDKILLGKHMAPVAPSFLGGVGAFEGDDDEEDAEDGDDEDAEPARGKRGSKGATPRKGAGPRLVAALLAGVPASEQEEALFDALDGVCEALHGREASARDRRQGEATLEVKLKAMGATVTSVRPEPPGGAEEVAARITELATAYATKSKSGSRAGGAGGGGGGDADSWGVAGGKPDVGLMSALQNLLADPRHAAAVRELVDLANKGSDEEMVRRFGELSRGEDMATLAYKGDAELKPPAGMRNSYELQELLHGVGRVRAGWVDFVAGRLRALELLPTGMDGRELAGHVVRGELTKLNWQATFGCKSTESLMGTLGGKGSKAKRVDSTEDAMLVFTRGFLVLGVAYRNAHPFDGTAGDTLAMLQTAVLRAVQDGVPVADAVAMVVDPFAHEMERKWDMVSRRAGMRPVMGEVAHALKANLTALRDFASKYVGTPPEKEKAAKSEKEKELQKENEQLRRDLKVLKKGTHPPAFGFAAERKAWEDEPANKGKCYFLEHFGTCKRGKACNAFATHQGHPE